MRPAGTIKYVLLRPARTDLRGGGLERRSGHHLERDAVGGADGKLKLLRRVRLPGRPGQVKHVRSWQGRSGRVSSGTALVSSDQIRSVN